LDIADSLAQEIWDVCFDKGLTINARDQVHSIAKRNKAYMRWF
jgi:ribosomal protein S7